MSDQIAVEKFIDELEPVSHDITTGKMTLEIPIVTWDRFMGTRSDETKIIEASRLSSDMKFVIGEYADSQPEECVRRLHELAWQLVNATKQEVDDD